ncbi:sodium/hydrogen exchanger 4 [Quercus suber]|uniref:Sodium/hydrogen exchanger 4 n=1 Tax=Quercus suber TaxID=58331 RepID=A0AAW0LEF7_QUESU
MEIKRLQSSKEQQQNRMMVLFDYVRNLGNQEHPHVLLITVFVAVLCLCLIIGHLLEENRWVNESITAILTVKKKQLFQNFLTIMFFGVFGVFISAVVITAAGGCFLSWDLLVLHQDETPLLYSLVFGEGVANDATSVVLFNAIQKLDVSRVDGRTVLHVIGDFFYLFLTSTALGVIV